MLRYPDAGQVVSVEPMYGRVWPLIETGLSIDLRPIKMFSQQMSLAEKQFQSPSGVLFTLHVVQWNGSEVYQANASSVTVNDPITY